MRLPAATEAFPDGPQAPGVWPMTITPLPAGPAKQREEQPVVKKTAPPRFLPPQEPRPAQVKMFFKRARLVSGSSGAERERVPPWCLPPLGSTPAMLFKRGPPTDTVCPQPEKNPGDLKGVPGLGVKESKVYGLEVRAVNQNNCVRFLPPPEPRRARIWKRTWLVQGLRMPLPSTRCLCNCRSGFLFNLRCVCGVVWEPGAEEKVAPPLYIPPLELMPAALFKLGLLAEGVRTAQTSGGFEGLGMGGFRHVLGPALPLTGSTPLVVGQPIRTRHHKPPSLLSSQNKTDSESRSIWESASGAGCSGLGQVLRWPTAQVGRLDPEPRQFPSASFTLRGEKHCGTPTQGRTITCRRMIRA
ncbi:uncharacterized protein LOC115542551 [Gadus morhua]|uniref:uncharacterized protein LOC115542551 n=1 Tax=Gadus morhua TaxID=8049 RepID=UPI0011B4895E|nr:uncharacterized protein LOC115542551 [Gadus morhua]